jgi:hypothetical protein
MEAGQQSPADEYYPDLPCIGHSDPAGEGKVRSPGKVTHQIGIGKIIRDGSMKQGKERKISPEQSSETVLNECLDLVIFDWGEGFCASPHFRNLSDDERLQSDSIAGFFTDIMFSYLGLTPPEWDADAMKECCVHLFPEKMSEGPEFFRCVVPVLSAFFAYLDEHHLQKNAGALAREIKNLHERIMERSSNPDNWGMSKRFVMAARSDGIDVTDPKAVHKCIEAYNRKVLKEGPESSMFYNAPHDSEVILRKGKKTSRKQ